MVNMKLGLGNNLAKLFVFISILLLGPAGIVNAYSQGDLQSIVYKTPFYDGSACSNAGSTTSSTTDTGGTLDQTLQAIALHESGGDPTANSGDGAYGKYQITPPTWKGYATAFYPPALQYANANVAPEDVQDAVAYLANIPVYNSFNGDPFWVAVHWYQPSATKAYPNKNDPSMDVAPPENGGLTYADYGNDIAQAVSTGTLSGKGPINKVQLSYTSAPDFQTYLAKDGGAPSSSPTTTTASATSSTSSSGTSSCSCSNSGSTTNGSKTIVLDPGHATQANELVDPATQEPVFDYSNPVEQQQVWDLSQDLKTKLQAAGYTVLVTKSSENDTSTNLKQRAEVGNDANAALGVSIHTTPGSPSVGNDVFYPVVGEYLVKTTGQHDVYTNTALAATDQKYGQTFASDLTQAEGVTFKSGGYDQIYGPITRVQDGVTMAGTMLVTQYFATIPWVYAEQYQDVPSNNSVSATAIQQYEAGLLKGIEDSVPINGSSAAATSSEGSGSAGCSASPATSCASGSTTVTGPNAAILCEAEKYNGIYYKWGGGHTSYTNFEQACPEAALPSAAAASTSDNPGPCGTDCSGLVSMALDGAYHQNFVWSVSNSTGQMSGGTDANDWVSIPIAQAQAGDIVTSNDGTGYAAPGTDGHVEIVDHVDGNTVYTFGSHSKGQKTSETSLPLSGWNEGAWRWEGPGSGSTTQ